MSVPAKNILLLMRSPPYQSARATEAIEVALVSGVFEQKTSVLFSGDGVWQLLPQQNADELGVRTVANMLQGLPEYDVSQLFVCAQSLAARGLDPSDLVMETQSITPTGVARLIAAQDLVFND